MGISGDSWEEMSIVPASPRLRSQLNRPLEAQSVNRYSGEFPRTLDEKNRVTVPSCWRSDDVPCLVALVNKTEDGKYVILMPRDEFNLLGDSAYTDERMSPAQRQKYRRKFFARSRECPIDKSGRVLLPQEMTAMFGDDRDVYLLGVGARIEIWNANEWSALNDDDDDDDFYAMATEKGL